MTNLENLAAANEVRIRRRELRERIMAGEVDLADVLENPPAYIERMTVVRILMMKRGVGDARARSIVRLRVKLMNPNVQLERLGPQRRRELIDALRRVPVESELL